MSHPKHHNILKRPQENFRNLFLDELVVDIILVFYLVLCNSQGYTGGSTPLKKIYNTSSLWFSKCCTWLQCLISACLDFFGSKSLFVWEVRLRAPGSASNVHTTDGPCWSASLSTGQLDRSSSGSTGTIVFKYNILFKCASRCSRLCFLHMRGTVGLKADLFWYTCGLAGTASSCHGLIDLHHESIPKRGWTFNSQSYWGCTTSNHVFIDGDIIWAPVFHVTKITCTTSGMASASLPPLLVWW